MAEEKNAICTLEDAFELLEPKHRAHSKRVAKYAEIIFTYAEAHDVYVTMPRAEKELKVENIPLMAAAGRYHEIEKAFVREEYTNPAYDSARFFEELCSAEKRYKVADRKLIQTAIMDQDEWMDGNGCPGKKSGEAISYMARILTLANDLDKLSMSLVSEHPLEDALREMKKNVPAKYDPEFYKAMKSCKAKLCRVFDAEREYSKAVPTAEPIIKRRVTRPMELAYRPVCNADGEVFAREAAMRFRNVKDNSLSYEDVKHIITKQSMGADICEYFLFEACDAIRRFDACGIETGWIGLEVLPTFYNKKKLENQLVAILEAETVEATRIRLLISASNLKKPSKTLAENIKNCKNVGILFVLTDVTREFLEQTSIGCEEYPFDAIRFTSDCLMDHSLAENEVFQRWQAAGVEILVDGVESKSVQELVAENGAVGYTGIFAGIYEREEDIIKRALEFASFE